MIWQPVLLLTWDQIASFVVSGAVLRLGNEKLWLMKPNNMSRERKGRLAGGCRVMNKVAFFWFLLLRPLTVMQVLY